MAWRAAQRHRGRGHGAPASGCARGRAAAALLLLGVVGLALPARAQRADGGLPPVPAEALPRLELAPPREERAPVVVPDAVLPPPADGGVLEAPELVPEEAAGERIREVRVTGNRRVDAAAIVRALPLGVGDTLTPRRAAEALQVLFDLGQFSDVRLLRTPAPGGGLVLEVQVEERPLVDRVQVVGGEALPPELRKELVTLGPGDVWRPEEARSIARALQARLVELGYDQAQVTFRTGPGAGGATVDVTFDVVAGPRVRVEQVRFLGAEGVLSEAELRARVQTREANLLTPLTRTGYLRRDLLAQDAEALRAALQDRGHAQARVEPEVSLSPDGRGAFVTFRLAPGPLYRLGQVRVESDPLPAEQERQLVRLEEGDVFRRSDVAAAVQGLTLALQDRGHAFAQVQPLVDLQPEGDVANLTLRVEAGPVVDVARIDITGNTRTRDAVIRRELLLDESERFSRTRLELGLARLRALDLFARVESEVLRMPEGEGAQVLIRVEEKRTGEYRAGVGFASAENAIVTGRITERNLLGRGQSLSAQAQYSSLRLLIEGTFTEPALLDSPVALSVNVYRNRYDFFSFARTATGAGVTTAYRFGAPGTPLERLVGSVGYLFERVAVDLAPALAPQAALLPYRSGRTSLVRLGLTLDTRDNPLFATRGVAVALSTELGPPFLGGTLLLARSTGVVRGAVPLPLGLVFKPRLTVGYIAPLGDTPLPASELFFAGGFGTVRGYIPRTLTPTAELLVPTPEGGVETRVAAVGGNKELAVGLDLEFPLLPHLGLKGVAFYDAGNAFAFDEPFFRDRQDRLPFGLFQGAGAGLRWLSPLGPLRLEWGFPLNRRPQDPAFQVEVGAGEL